MKYITVLLVTLLFSIQGFSSAEFTYSPVVKDARFNISTGMIEVDLGHGGGCSEHKYKLSTPDMCLESFPVQCSIEITDTTDDTCEAYLQPTVTFAPSDAGLIGSYFYGARITVRGGGESSASFSLPRE